MTGSDYDGLDLGDIEPGAAPGNRTVKPGAHPWAPSQIDAWSGIEMKSVRSGVIAHVEYLDPADGQWKPLVRMEPGVEYTIRQRLERRGST